jgi:hypothetical protein
MTVTTNQPRRSRMTARSAAEARAATGGRSGRSRTIYETFPPGLRGGDIAEQQPGLKAIGVHDGIDFPSRFSC